MSIDPIEAYLRKLRRHWRARRRRGRLAAEVEDHLHSAAQDLEARGLPPDEAMREAIARFGDPPLDGASRWTGGKAWIVAAVAALVAIAAAVAFVSSSQAPSTSGSSAPQHIPREQQEAPRLKHLDEFARAIATCHVA